MKSVVSLISDIEKEASIIVANASDKKLAMYKDLENKMEEIDKKYNNKFKEEIENLNNKYNKSYLEEIKRVEEASDKDILELENMYKAKHDKYIDSLFNRIIGM